MGGFTPPEGGPGGRNLKGFPKANRKILLRESSLQLLRPVPVEVPRLSWAIFPLRLSSTKARIPSHRTPVLIVV